MPDKDIIFPRETWGDSIWGRAIREKKTLCSNGPFNPPKGHIAVHRWLGVPILFQGNSIGLFQVANKATDYDEKDIQLLETIAEHIAPILSARLQAERQEKERKEMQQRLLRSEKLAVLGQLAGGVGHELRNPLGAIKNAAYFLNMALEKPEPEVKETLEILEQEVASSERIISSLLGFARPKPPTLRKVDINSIIQEALSRASVPENVEAVSQLDKTVPTILADPDQLGQVFGNIILNAVQAMPEGGKLTIKSEVPAPEWVNISFTDTGIGIPKENLTKLFEPLFTTKAKGIGLGLAVTKTLVEGLGGTIEAQSEVGKGHGQTDFAAGAD